MPIKPENRNRYPADWPEIRARILARAWNRCEWCGARNYAVGHRDRQTGAFIPTGGNLLHDEAGAGCLSYAEARAFADECNEHFGGVGPEDERAVVIVLTIAHVDDPNPENCAEDNLAALCQGCHNRHDRKHRAQTARETREQMRGQLALPECPAERTSAATAGT